MSHSLCPQAASAWPISTISLTEIYILPSLICSPPLKAEGSVIFLSQGGAPNPPCSLQEGLCCLWIYPQSSPSCSMHTSHPGPLSFSNSGPSYSGSLFYSPPTLDIVSSVLGIVLTPPVPSAAFDMGIILQLPDSSQDSNPGSLGLPSVPSEMLTLPPEAPFPTSTSFPQLASSEYSSKPHTDSASARHPSLMAQTRACPSGIHHPEIQCSSVALRTMVTE